MSLSAILKDREKKAEDFAEGLPDPQRFGRTSSIPLDKLLPYFKQLHLAERAGRHYDVRMGGGPPGGELFSWATRKELPQPKGRPITLFQQPLHRLGYGSFSGTLASGYGKGKVSVADKGDMIVTHASPTKIKFVLTHKRYPEFFSLIRQSGPPGGAVSSNTKRKQGGSWLMINTTPMDAAKLLGGDPKEVGLEKLKYTSIPAEQVDKIFDPKYLVQEKVDGASMLYHVLKDRIDAVSYRTSTTGRPIIHSHRLFGAGAGRGTHNIPPELEGSILKGEAYGTREGKAIPPQELGGILNASVSNSLQKQRQQKVKMRNMLFDIVRLGKTPVQDMGAEDKLQKLKELLPYLPKGKFHLPETAKTPEEAKALWERVTTGQNPRTSEGVIAWPKEVGKRPIKVKTTPEADVFVRGIFPGQGRLKGTGAGGFEYSAAPEGDVVGRVGTGFNDQTRQEMEQDPEVWLGRMARIKSQGKFPSGAHRAPVFIALNEDKTPIS